MHKLVNSFDIFDTLIGRMCGDPEGIFLEVSKIIENPKYPQLRKLAESKSNGKWDHLWEIFSVLSKLSFQQTEDIKNLEWSIEKEYSFPIAINTVLLDKQDILVSDMYLSENMIKELLSHNNINNYDKIYVTPNGKRSGAIWPIIKNDGYIINKHTGDNYLCDIESPKQYGIKTSFFDKNYSDSEKYLISKDYTKVANLCRIVRYSNVYLINQNNSEHIIWNKLSGIVPVCKLLFFYNHNKTSCAENALNILRFYNNYINSIELYYKLNIQNIITLINNIIDQYLLKLKINESDCLYNYNLIYYFETYYKK